ncbi:MAG: M48 family metallopeptidase [Alphaproteobacteria bacterium]|nr:M48 family metallopeptidase [Alphaproteobacteria bacterium]
MAKIKTVYDHIRSNNIKTAILVALFPLSFIALIFLFCWIIMPARDALNTTIQVAIPTFIVCAVWMLISWAFGDSMMLSGAGAVQIHDNDPENKKIFRAVENVALAAGLPTPRVYIIEDNGLNAFATGRNPRDASVALTRGIINKLDDLELQGVIAHEMSHIGNRDIRLDMLLITGVGVTVFAADVLMRSIIYGNHSSNDDNGKNNTAAVLFMVWLAFTVFNFIVSPLLQLAVSRKREFAADACGAQITRNPAALASALRKISDNPRVKNLEKSKSMAIACIAEPRKALMGDLFSTHPSTKERIKRLESM